MKGKVAIVTGSATGVGAATVVMLAQKGCNVVINYTRSKEEAMATAQLVEQHNVESLVFQADVSNDDDCQSMVEAAIKKWGKIRLVRELKFRAISKYSIDTALKEIDLDDYYTTLDELTKKRIAQVNEKNIYKKKKKVADYLFYRGWESHLVYEKLNEYIK